MHMRIKHRVCAARRAARGAWRRAGGVRRRDGSILR